jgi:PAS domain S-box-containing protein
MPGEIKQPVIFVVDDDEGLLFLIKQALRREEWSVATAKSSAAALEWLADNVPDLMLLDLELADINASRLIEQLAENNRSAPFIIITGQGDERVAVDMMKRGALDYLVKGLQFLDFIPEVVRRALEQLARTKRLAEAEEDLRQSAHRERQQGAELAAILDAVPMPVFIAHDPDCLHITGNRAAHRLLRIPRGGEASLAASDEARPRHFKAVKDGRELRTDELPAQRAARGFTVQNFEFSLVFDDGTTREILACATPLEDEEGRPRGAINVLVDITERKQAELTGSRLAAIVESSTDAILGRALNGTITNWNKGAEAMFGYSTEEIMGAPISALVPPDRREEFDHVFEQVQSGEIVPAFESARFGKDGRHVDVAVRVSPIKDRSGNIIGVSSILREITERKRLEKEVLEISEREQSRIGQDLHDGLCQHLAGIEFRLLGLKQKLEGKSARQGAEIGELTKLVRQGIEQTRTLARGLSPVMLEADGLMNALEELAVQTHRAFDVSCSFGCPLPILFQDNAVSTHLYRIAQEAIHNAVRHGRAKFISVTLLRVNDRVVLGIRDDGVGFPKKPVKHQGMGMRVMQYRAHMVGGAFVVQHNPDGGTSVVCSLKAAEAVSKSERTKRKRPRARGLN